MGAAAVLAALLLAAAPVAAAGPVRTQAVEPVFYGYQVVRVRPHDREAFTQGLAYVGGILFESTGRYPSTVRRVRLDDGVVEQRVELSPDLFGEGLTEIDGRLITLTWHDGKGFVWNAADLSRLGEFPLEGEGWGLTDDGRRLIVSDGTPVLRFLDPATMTETGRVQVTFRGRPLPRLNELEWIDGEVWANVWTQDAIVRIDPATGVVTGVVDLTGLLPDRTGMQPADDVLNGIAWDSAGRRLFVTGKNWPSLFEIRLTEAP
ncbi:glutaminyl-peptide cyclotransferase [Brevundimonas sp.]|uniref:glutaminyl-peptide cyclotransferase n=1 Tax=Brevundimonas sp. TaxID=1871086 RepID=UPI002D658F70|nr:glutaminyl-peptide cyclotransferase [Brevundimonas sp.]HYC68362.1 glutaminyl-peptide cyclotransferase [Brevundimonas sp.]